MGGGIQIYLRVLRVCPKLNLHGYTQGICGMNGVSETVVHNACEGVIKIDTSRSLFRSSRFLWVFFHRLRFDRGVGFSPDGG